ncbi:MAG: hypothetical protein K1X67_08775 [Fimbriimonadaceae bacterium]|nr:hypothetical protein [Fimbriimonadaceae bacterium]
MADYQITFPFVDVSVTAVQGGTASPTSTVAYVRSPQSVDRLAMVMERFADQLALAKEDAQDAEEPLPTGEAVTLARQVIGNWVHLQNATTQSVNAPLGITFTHRGDLELVMRDVLLDRDRVLWVSQDAKRIKELGIDEALRVVRQMTERLW